MGFGLPLGYLCLPVWAVCWVPAPAPPAESGMQRKAGNTKITPLLSEDVSPEVHLPRAQASWGQTLLHVAVWVPPPWRL